MSSPWESREPNAEDIAAFADSEMKPFWLDALAPRDPHPVLTGVAEADLCIVGGGFTGLWAALQAITDEPGRSIVLLEAETIAFGASGRNGGFLEQSLTHGIANGVARFPDEIATIERLAAESFDGLIADIAKHSIDCDLSETGSIDVAIEPHELCWMHESAKLLAQHGCEVEVFDSPEAMRAEVNSPLYIGGVWAKAGAATVDPARLADGLLTAVLKAGVRVCENPKALKLESDGQGVRVTTEAGSVEARRVVLATSAHEPLVSEIKRYVAPVYDYVLMTEPLTEAQLDSIGWKRRQGISDSANRFHYYRLSADNRIPWVGFEAVYPFAGRATSGSDGDQNVFAALARNFFTTFPQLEGVSFSHRWGGAIDTCSRFSPFFGTSLDGRVAYVAGYTGLGVGATRFGARVALDLADGRDTEATRLKMVRPKPVPFPPEPLRSAVIQLTRNRLAAADATVGKRGAVLRRFDPLGLGSVS